MSRDVGSNNLSALVAEHIGVLVYFAELDFASGVVRAHTGLGTISFGGNDYTGVGTFGSASIIEESAEITSKRIAFRLSGIPNSFVALALNDDYRGRPAKLYLGILDSQTGALKDDPFLLAEGLMDTSETEEGEEVSITITAEGRSANWERARFRRITDADQQTRFPGDLGLQFVDQAAQKEIIWGRGEKT